MIGEAIHLAAAGFAVFPLHSMQGDAILDDLACSCDRACSSPGKHPRTQRGCLDATTDADTIRGWWAQWPDANIGIATGVPSGCYVVDLDGEPGARSWAALRIPEPGMRATTGSRGRHLYYGLAEGESLPNTAGRLGLRIDTRGTGGYVVAPPSNHKSGGTYRWEAYGALTPLPAALREALAPRTTTPAAAPRLSGETSAYGTGVLVNACRRIAQAPDGARNATLNDEAFLVGQFVGGGEIDPAGVEQLLAEACTGPDVKKNHATVRRGLHAGMMHGRAKPTDDNGAP